jgi:predicted nucleic acid-binding protein
MVGKAARTAEPFPKKRSPDTPIYAIDLNVFFDAIRNRTRSDDAGLLFRAALSHQIRIAVSPEFVAELQRTSNNADQDPVLSLAMRFPTLAAQQRSVIEDFATRIAKVVFPERSSQARLRSTDKSDVLHLAHAVASGAAGYITSDEKVLSSRDSLMADCRRDRPL